MGRLTSYPAQVVILATIVFLGCERQEDVRHETTGTTKVQPQSASAMFDVVPLDADGKTWIARLLAPRTMKAEIYTIFAPADVIATGQKLKTAMQSNPVAAAMIMANQDPDGKVKYDPRMGVTRDEYARLLRGTELWELKVTGEATITIKKLSDSVYEILGLPGIEKAVYDTNELSVNIPFGKLKSGELFAPNDGQRLTGPIAGIRWRSSSIGSLVLDDDTFWTSLVAQSQSTHDVWLEFRVKDNQTRQDRLHYFARFSGPRK